MAGELSADEAKQLGLSDAEQPPPQGSEVSGGDAASLGLTAPAEVPQDQAAALGLEAPTVSDAQFDRTVAAHGAATSMVTPEKQLEVTHHAAALGLPPGVVGANLEASKTSLTQAALEAAQMTSPAYSRMLGDPAKAPIVKDDWEHLTALEWAFGKWEHVPGRLIPKLKQGPALGAALADAVGYQTEFLPLANADAAGIPLRPDQRQRLDELTDKYSEQNYGASNFLSKGVTAAVRMIPYIAGSVVARAAGGVAGAAAAGTGGVETGPGEVGVIPAGAVAGQYAGGVAFDTFQNFGPIYRSIRKSSPDLPDGKARGIALASSTAAAMVMSGAGSMVLKNIPWVKGYLNKAAADGIGSALKSETTATIIKNFSLRYGESLAAGAAMMSVQNGANAAALELAKSQSGGTANLRNVSDALADGFGQGFKDMWLLAAFGPGHSLIQDRGRAAVMEHESRQLAAMVESAQGSKLLDRSPELFEEFVQHASSAEGAPKSVFIDRGAWDRFWQEKKTDPAKVASEVMGDAGKAYGEALGTGGDLTIPVEKYLSKLGKTEHVLGLRDELRLSEDGLSPREAREEAVRMQVVAKEEAGATETDTSAGVHEDLRQKAIDAGVDEKTADATASLVAASFRNFGKALGTDALTAYQRLADVRVVEGKGTLEPETAAAAQPERHGQADLDTSDIQPERGSPKENPNLQPMREAYAKLTPEERARKLHLDRVSGIREAEVFDQAPVPEGKVVAVITSPSVKGINDHMTAGGHDAANALLTDMAHAVSKGHQEAARGGTNFRVYLDAADADKQLAGVLDRVRRAVGPDVDVVGAHGKDTREASEKLGTSIDTARDAKTLPKRGALRDGVDVARLTFKGKPVNAKPPMEHVQRMANTPEQEAFAKTFQDRVWVGPPEARKAEPSGVLSAKGFYETPPRENTVAFDLRNLGKVPKETGDQMILRFGQALREAGGDHVDAAHLSGDEYAAKHDDPEVLARFAQRVRRALDAQPPLMMKGPSGEPVKVDVGYRHGIGRDYAAADRDLNVRRARESDNAGGARGEVHAGGAGGVEAGESGAGPGPAGVELRPGGHRGEVRPGALADEAEVRRQPWEHELDGTEPRPEEVDRHAQEQQDTVRLDKKGERGFIEFSPGDGSGKPRRFDIHILENADKSTFAHEAMHFLSQVMADAAQSEGASEGLKTDYLTLLTFMGHASHEERRAHASERRDLVQIEQRTPEQEQRLTELSAKEERVTHAWEQYLLEGKAPSAELVPVFTRFKNWLTKIYRGVQGVGRQFRQQYGEELKLSDDVRGVFDRMLASEDEVQKAQAAEEAQPFREATARMSPTELVEYADATDQARAVAEQDMLRRITEGQRKENSAFMHEERERIRGEVDQELDQNQVYSTLKSISEGDLLTGNPLKLERSNMARKYGADFVRSMPREIWAKRGEGLSAEELAARTGWESGDAMVRALQASKPREQLVAEQVQQRMEAAHGPTLLDNGPWLAAQALDAVHNPAAARKAILELNALRRALQKGAGDVMSGDRAELLKTKSDAAQEAAGAQARASADKADAAEGARIQRSLRNVLRNGFKYEAAQDMARQLVAGKTVGELTAGEQGLSGVYLRNERKAAREAIDAAAKGDLLSAIAFKERQLLNMALFREARDLRGEFEKATDKLQGAKKAEWRAQLGKADPAYRDAHDAILQAIGLQKPPTEGQPPPSIDTLLTRATADAQDLDFDTEALRALVGKPRSPGASSPWTRRATSSTRSPTSAPRRASSRRSRWRASAWPGGPPPGDGGRCAKRPAQPLAPRDASLKGWLDDGRRVLQSLDAQLRFARDARHHARRPREGRPLPARLPGPGEGRPGQGARAQERVPPEDCGGLPRAPEGAPREAPS
jgi:GGDEF domain-containing protein